LLPLALHKFNILWLVVAVLAGHRLLIMVKVAAAVPVDS
jgi:hypothetical protein